MSSPTSAVSTASPTDQDGSHRLAFPPDVDVFSLRFQKIKHDPPLRHLQMRVHDRCQQTSKLGNIVIHGNIPYSKSAFTGSCQLLDGTSVDVVIKFATTQDALDREIKVYTALQHLQGSVIPVFYGAMQTSTNTGEFGCIVLERFGKIIRDEHFQRVSPKTL